MASRRAFKLALADETFLNEYGFAWETVLDGSQWVLIHDLPVPDGYNEPKVTVAIRLELGYPNTPLDMAYFLPGLSRKDGRAIGATESTQIIEGKAYQRWSRHRTDKNPWVPGRDNIGSHVLLIEDWLEREFEKWPSL